MVVRTTHLLGSRPPLRLMCGCVPREALAVRKLWCGVPSTRAVTSRGGTGLTIAIRVDRCLTALGASPHFVSVREEPLGGDGEAHPHNGTTGDTPPAHADGGELTHGELPSDPPLGFPSHERWLDVAMDGWAELPEELAEKVLELLHAAGQRATQAGGLGFTRVVQSVVCSRWCDASPRSPRCRSRAQAVSLRW
jgi:hypothetical protein